MGQIRKLKSEELLGSVDNTDIYPVTSTDAVFNDEGQSVTELLNNKADKRHKHTAEELEGVSIDVDTSSCVHIDGEETINDVKTFDKGLNSNGDITIGNEEKSLNISTKDSNAYRAYITRMVNNADVLEHYGITPLSEEEQDKMSADELLEWYINEVKNSPHGDSITIDSSSSLEPIKSYLNTIKETAITSTFGTSECVIGMMEYSTNYIEDTQGEFNYFNQRLSNGWLMPGNYILFNFYINEDEKDSEDEEDDNTDDNDDQPKTVFHEIETPDVSPYPGTINTL